ncbi:T9SS type A sorting domain-containing protein [Cytophagaceae bacterium YF14B1]|uniref:T9SS type A sorting domain-containing protein n=1 Tax=Xanthocytophaga flava TaxID=3048013 RepID=A0AAE3UD63_9BACT|nr:T9SS type A sorting domain-containing protein [Xanthocytophaga flavus]MDJ1485569.1 T9SS type A sorting domain-containing protein [Xanthocytophaga flavus]
MPNFFPLTFLSFTLSPLSFKQKSFAFWGLFIVLNAFQTFEAKAQSSGYVWKNAPIGGGGFVTGIVTHKTSGDRYCRTDVGGAYRWDGANNKWIQLLDWINESENGFIGVEALALDPQNANNVYMLCGTSYINGGRTAILKSTDKGNTFTYTDVTSKFKAHGNGGGRSNGERLAVDPKNGNILYCGTRDNGLWKSTDAGLTWNLAWNGVTTTGNGNGICFVLFDPSSSTVNGASQTIYVGVSRTGGATLYRSTNGGASFTDISPTTSFMPHRAALQGTTMYVTYANGEGPNLGEGSGKIYKYNTSTGAWTNVTPVHSKDYPYGGVSIDPTNVNRVIVSTCGMYWNNQFGTGWGDFVFLTTDGGSTWTLKNGSNATYDANGMEWSRAGAINWMDCIEFDQASLNKVRVIGGGGIYTCPDITATNTSWKYDVIGIEETAFLDGTSIPGGPFISSFGDVSGFVHEPITSASSTKLSPAGGYNNHSIAYAAGNTNKVVRIGNGDNVVYYSNDKGATWTGSSSNMGASGRVAVSADGGSILHCPGGSTTTYYTTNNGASWSACSGISLGDAAPVADQVNSNYFYIFHPATGQMFRSSNKGVSFSVVGTPGASTANYPWESVLIRTVPGFDGHVWVPLGGNGLKYSTNGGTAYTTLANVSYCKSIGIGKAMSGSTYPTIYIWGTVSGVTGLFRSSNQGSSWIRLNDDAHEFAGAPFLIGDMNVSGRVYMSSGGGRGVIYWEPSGSCTSTTITPYIQVNGGTWQQTSTASLAAGGTLQLGPQPTTGGSWSWSGPNNFSASTREVYLSNIQANQAGNYIATYTNSEGCQSTQTFTVTVAGTIVIRARGTQGTETMELRVNNTVVGTWTLSTAYQNYSASGSGSVSVHFTNDNTGRDVQVDYAIINGVTYQSEVQPTNTGVWTTTCGGSNSEWLNCNGYIQYTSGGARMATADRSTADRSITDMDTTAISLYPNPSSKGIFTILSPQPVENALIRIYDSQGRLVYQKNASDGKVIQIDSQLKAGFYVVSINSKGFDCTRKLVVH